MTSWHGLFPRLARAGRDAVLTPLVVALDLVLAAVNATLWTTAWVTETAAHAVNGIGTMPFAGFIERFSGRVAGRTLGMAKDDARLAMTGLSRAFSRNSPPTTCDLLASTLLAKVPQTALLPVLIAADAVATMVRGERSRQRIVDWGRRASRRLDRYGSPGVLSGSVGPDTRARLRWGFCEMAGNGPVEAVLRDVRGVVGGLLALALGDSDWLAQGLKDFRVSAGYVHEKVSHGEVGPMTDIPISESLGRYGSRIVHNYPDAFVQALASETFLEVVRTFLKEAGEVMILFTNYPVFTCLVLRDVAVFMGKALFDGPDAEKYALCELAIMDSALSSDAKDAALATLRKTAPNTTIEYEYYVPLLVPFDGTARDTVLRRTAAGEAIDTRAVVPSVFKQIAMQIAESLCSEVIALRSFLWLYGDVEVARQKNWRETARKFGPEVAQRIAGQPRYPLTTEQVSELTQAGPREPAAAAAILDGLLRERGLDEIAEFIALSGRCRVEARMDA